MQSYFAETKNIKLNSKGYFIMKIPNKRELQQTTIVLLILTLKILLRFTTNKQQKRILS